MYLPFQICVWGGWADDLFLIVHEEGKEINIFAFDQHNPFWHC